MAYMIASRKDGFISAANARGAEERCQFRREDTAGTAYRDEVIRFFQETQLIMMMAPLLDQLLVASENQINKSDIFISTLHQAFVAALQELHRRENESLRQTYEQLNLAQQRDVINKTLVTFLWLLQSKPGEYAVPRSVGRRN